MADEGKILVGKIAAPQGLRGEFRVQTYTERPEDLKDFSGFGIRDSGFVKIEFVRAAGQNTAICKMNGVDDRTAAEKLRGTELFANREDFPKLGKGEHYIADLIGMKVITNPESRIPNPEVIYVHNFGDGDILELDNGAMIGFNGAKIDYDKREIKYEKENDNPVRDPGVRKGGHVGRA
ncbi:MAG: ribosome maturation factor RimM [Rickettsiales bacterium]|jgi:16S rRNA processing protein RimM|nr:ribosome maturation factor RimM [Rickettsiales bacterium]